MNVKPPEPKYRGGCGSTTLALTYVLLVVLMVLTGSVLTKCVLSDVDNSIIDDETYVEIAPARHEAMGLTESEYEELMFQLSEDPWFAPQASTAACDTLNQFTEPSFIDYHVANTWPGNAPGGVVEVYADGYVLNWVDTDFQQMPLQLAIEIALDEVSDFEKIYWISNQAQYIHDSVFVTNFAALVVNPSHHVDLKIRITGKKYTANAFEDMYMINSVGSGLCDEVLEVARHLPSMQWYNVKWVGCDSLQWVQWHEDRLANCKCCACADLRGIPIDSTDRQMYLDQQWTLKE